MLIVLTARSTCHRSTLVVLLGGILFKHNDISGGLPRIVENKTCSCNQAPAEDVQSQSWNRGNNTFICEIGGAVIASFSVLPIP